MGYPYTNGYAYTIHTAHIVVAQARVFCISDIKWTESMDGREQVPGAALVAIAETPGMYKATVEFSLLKSEYMALINRLGSAGFMMRRFNMHASLQDPSGVLPLVTVVFPQLGINEASGNLDASASKISIKTTVGPGATIMYNGLSAINLGTLSPGNTFGGIAATASAGFSL
jgi:hypothetical protein